MADDLHRGTPRFGTVTAALIWVLRAYVAFYSFLGLFVGVLMAAGLLGRFWSTRHNWHHVPSRYSDALARSPSSDYVRGI